jgi:hypothetical protein
VLKDYDFGWVEFPPLIGGVRRFVKFDEKGDCTVRYESPMSGIKAALDNNAVARNDTSGKMLDGNMVRVASIPAAVQLKWLVEEGLDTQKPEHADRLRKKLMDPDWAYLRTGGGRLAMTQNGEIR